MLSELPDPKLFSLLAERHGHYCPMSTLGVRIGWAARRRLEGAPVSAVFKIQTCAVDGIRLVLNYDGLRIDAQETHRLSVSDCEHDWSIELRPETLELAASYRQLGSESERGALLEQLRTAAESSLLIIVREWVAP